MTPISDFAQKLKALHQINADLLRTPNLLALYQQAIILGRSQLGFDRLTLLILDNEQGIIQGTFCTDPHGQVVGEIDRREPLVNEKNLLATLNSDDLVRVIPDGDLYYRDEFVGRGWRVVAVLWNGEERIGWLVADNLLHQQPITNDQIELLTLYSTTLGHLITRRRTEAQLRQSESELRERTRILSMINRMADTLHHSLDWEVVAAQAVALFVEHMGAMFTAIYEVDAERNQVTRLFSTGLPDAVEVISRVLDMGDTLIGAAIQSEEVLVSHTYLDPDPRLNPTIRETLATSQTAQIMLIPMPFNDSVLGAVVVGFHQPIKIDTNQRETLAAIGKTISLALTNARFVSQLKREVVERARAETTREQLLQSLQHRNQQLERVGELTRSIVSILHPNALLQSAVEQIGTRFQYASVCVYLVQRNQAVLRAITGDTAQKHLVDQYTLDLNGTAPACECIRTAQPVIHSGIEDLDGYQPHSHIPQHGSEMALPLVHNEQVMGALTLHHEQADAFDFEDAAVFRLLADHLASAIENARLYEIINRRQRYLRTLRRVSNRVTGERSQQGLMQTVVERLARDFNYAVVAIWRIDTDLHQQRLAAFHVGAHLEVAPAMDWGHYQQQPIAATKLKGWLTNRPQTYWTPNLHTDPTYDPLLTMLPIRSELVAPIVVFGKVQAALAIGALAAGELDDLDLEMMDDLAAELSLHLENLDLFARAERNAAILEVHVEERTEQLEQANRELEAFAYSVSHDLRAPLRSIGGFSQTLHEEYHDILDESGRDYLRRIQAASTRMGDLIDDLLALSRVTRRPFERTPVDLSDLAAGVVAELRHQQPDHLVQVDIQPGMSAQGDLRLLQIALENLLGNAWKFTRQEPQPRVRVGCHQHDAQTVYYVADNGVGFDMTHANHLFHAFHRLHEPAEFEGTGIGLATVYRVIQRHSGAIWAEAAVGEGATFYFTLD